MPPPSSVKQSAFELLRERLNAAQEIAVAGNTSAMSRINIHVLSALILLDMVEEKGLFKKPEEKDTTCT